MVKILDLIKAFELLVDDFSLCKVGLDGQVLLVFLSDKIFVFLLHFKLG